MRYENLSAVWAKRTGPITYADVQELVSLRSIYEFGLTPTRKTAQAAIDAAAEDGFELHFPGDMELDLDGPLYVRENLKLRLDSTTIITRQWDGGTSFGSGLLTQEDWSADEKISNVQISGGIWKGNDKTGRVFELYGDKCQALDVVVDGWGTAATGSWGLLFIGNDFLARGIRFANPGAIGQGVDGIHVAGGARGLVLDVRGTTGDDIVGFFPIVAAGGIPDGCANQDITDLIISGVRGNSVKARLIAGGLHDSSLTCTIKNIGISHVHGSSAAGTSRQGMYFVKTAAASGIVKGISLSDVSLQCTAGATAGGISFEGVKDISIDTLALIGGTATAFNIDGVDNLRCRNFSIDATTGTYGINNQNINSSRVFFSNGDILCGSNDGIRLGTTGGITVDKGRLQDINITEVPTGKRGVYFERATNIEARRIVATKASGASTTVGFRETSGSSGLSYYDNDVSGCDTGVENRQSSSKRFYNNTGFISEATVSVSIASGQTTGSSAHGLPYTPQAANVVSIISTGNARSTTGIRASFTSTDVTLTSDVAASGGSATYQVKIALYN